MNNPGPKVEDGFGVDRGYMNEQAHTLILGFPKPSAWMLYAVWSFPIFFMVLFYRMFDRWHFTAEDAKRLEEIAASQRQSDRERD